MPWDQPTRTERDCYEAHSLSRSSTGTGGGVLRSLSPIVLLYDQYPKTTSLAALEDIDIHFDVQTPCRPGNGWSEGCRNSISTPWAIFDHSFYDGVNNMGDTSNNQQRYHETSLY